MEQPAPTCTVTGNTGGMCTSSSWPPRSLRDRLEREGGIEKQLPGLPSAGGALSNKRLRLLQPNTRIISYFVHRRFASSGVSVFYRTGPGRYATYSSAVRVCINSSLHSHGYSVEDCSSSWGLCSKGILSTYLV